MNPLPYGGAPPMTPLATNGYVEPLMLLTIVSVAVIFAFMLWSSRRTDRIRVRLFCPVRLRRVRVLFGLGPGGMAEDVLRCSEFRGNAITCGKACLHTTVR